MTGTGEAHCPGGLFVARSIVTMLRNHGARPSRAGCGFGAFDAPEIVLRGPFEVVAAN